MLIRKLAWLIFFSISIAVNGQEINPQKLENIPHSPGISINNKNFLNRIPFDSLMKYGLRVVLADTSFRVVQYDIVYDCPSKGFSDFTIRRYIGDKISPSDEYLKTKVRSGDVLDVVNTVIEKKGYHYVMKGVAFLVVN